MVFREEKCVFPELCVPGEAKRILMYVASSWFSFLQGDRLFNQMATEEKGERARMVWLDRSLESWLKNAR